MKYRAEVVIRNKENGRFRREVIHVEGKDSASVQKSILGPFYYRNVRYAEEVEEELLPGEYVLTVDDLQEIN